jgi:ABC-type transporter Mla MlaB component
MKTSKRKRSPKSEPLVEALDSAPVAASAEPAPVEVIASDSANEPVVAETVVAVEVVASEPVVAESEPVAAVVVESAPVAATAAEPVIVLSANCSVKDSTSLKNSLCALANESAVVTVDASAVERVDTATMQLLCAFARDRSARKQSIVWRGQSQALNDAVRLLGIAALMGFDTAQGAVA